FAANAEFAYSIIIFAPLERCNRNGTNGSRSSSWRTSSVVMIQSLERMPGRVESLQRLEIFDQITLLRRRQLRSIFVTGVGIAGFFGVQQIVSIIDKSHHLVIVLA